MHKRICTNDSSFCIPVTEHQYVLGTYMQYLQQDVQWPTFV